MNNPRRDQKKILAADGWDGNGLQLEKLANFFKLFPCILKKSLKTDYSSSSL